MGQIQDGLLDAGDEDVAQNRRGEVGVELIDLPLDEADFQLGVGQGDRATLGGSGDGGPSQTPRHRPVQAGRGHAHQHCTLRS